MKHNKKKEALQRLMRGVVATAACMLPATLFAGTTEPAATTGKVAKQDQIVVYPSSATSRNPEIISGLPALRPVPEKSELDPETPLGQVRAILETLAELRSGAQATGAAVERIESTLDRRSNELRETLDSNAQRLATLEDAFTRQGAARRVAEDVAPVLGASLRGAGGFARPLFPTRFFVAVVAAALGFYAGGRFVSKNDSSTRAR